MSNGIFLKINNTIIDRLSEANGNRPVLHGRTTHNITDADGIIFDSVLEIQLSDDGALHLLETLLERFSKDAPNEAAHQNLFNQCNDAIFNLHANRPAFGW